jgi:hypothetical protein
MKPVKVLLFILLTLCSLGLASKFLAKLSFSIAGEKVQALSDFTQKYTEKPDSTAYFAQLQKIE